MDCKYLRKFCIFLFRTVGGGGGCNVTSDKVLARATHITFDSTKFDTLMAQSCLSQFNMNAGKLNKFGTKDVIVYYKHILQSKTMELRNTILNCAVPNQNQQMQ